MQRPGWVFCDVMCMEYPNIRGGRRVMPLAGHYKYNEWVEMCWSYLFIWAISLSHSLIRSLLMSQGDSESVPYLVGSASGPRNELSKSRGLNQSCGDARDPNLTSSSSCAQVRQYRIPECSEFMKFSVRIPILNFRKYSAQVQVTPENSDSMGILVLHSNSQTYATDE